MRNLRYRLLQTLRNSYDFFIKHWIISSILVTVPAFWFLLLELQGQALGLVSDNGVFSPLAKIIFWLLFAVSLVIALIKAAGDKYNETAKHNGQLILRNILDSTTAFVNHKMDRYFAYISKNHSMRRLHPFSEIVQPHQQMRILITGLQRCLSNIFDIKPDEISVSVFYRLYTYDAQLDPEDEWQWLADVNREFDIPEKDLFTNPRTTFRRIVDGDADYLFFPDKRIAASGGNYVYGPHDDRVLNIGSILCQRIFVRRGKKFVEAILSISTYGKQICHVDDIYAEEKLSRVVLPAFEKRICLELSLLYMREVIAGHSDYAPPGGDEGASSLL